MAKALAKGFTDSGQVQGKDICFFDPSPLAVEAFESEVKAAQSAARTEDVIASSEVVFIAVKPQHLATVFPAVSNPSCLFISIVAGAKLAALTAGLGTDRVIRVMPNTPCLVGEGASAYCLASGVTDDDSALIGTLLSTVGFAVELPEANLDAVTGLSGSGPAFVYQMIEAMSDGGVRVGLPRHVATRLAAQTVLGAAKMVLDTEAHPGVLKDRVASPGGTTIAGLHALERGGLRATVMNAVEAATGRSTELGKAD